VWSGFGADNFQRDGETGDRTPAIDQPQDAQHHAEHERRHDRKIERIARALDYDVAGEAAESEFSEQRPQHACRDEQ